MIDLLSMVYYDDVSEEEAQRILDSTICDFHVGKLKINIPSELMLNNYEWTAICHGVHLNVIAKWRVDGWPRKCSVCKREIDYRKYGWTIKSDKLCHVICSNENLAETDM